jgi:hypothetical protein
MDHLASLQELTAPGGPIDTDAPTATHHLYAVDGDPARSILSRARLQRSILNEFFAEKAEVICDRQAVVMAGPPGAGKSSARRQRIPVEEEKYWRFIDPDEFKTRLLRHARQSGEYDDLIPEEVRARIAAGEVFAPGEFASLVHEESSYLAKLATRRALARGERVVIDGVHGSAEKLGARVRQLADAGYASVGLICVDGSREVTRARVLARWAKGYDRYLADPEDEDAAYGARYVPESITDVLYADGERFSACAAAVAKVTEGAPENVVVQADVYYVATETSAGELWQSYHKGEGGFAVEKHLVLPVPESREAVAPVIGDADPGGVYVSEYQRADGTLVRPHTRRRPESS